MAETQYVTLQVHEEFAKRIDAEESRQNHRLEELEDNVKKISDLTISIRDLTNEIKMMTKQVEKQGERIEHIEKRPMESLNTIKVAILSGLGGAIASGIVAGIIFAIQNVH